jgi:HSP20 family protein
MALIRWEPKGRGLEPIRGLRDEVDRLFEDFFRGWSHAPWVGRGLVTAGREFLPSVDLREGDQEFTVTAEIPGLSKEEISVTITEDSVALKGERKEVSEKEKASYHYQETAYGAFQRVIPLPAKIKPDAAKARLKDGVLTLTLPKAERSKGKQVTVMVE